MSIQEKLKLIAAYKERNTRLLQNKILYKFFEPGTKLSIDHYKKHKEFFDAGRIHDVRLMIAGNRVGKTESCGLFELVCHAIDYYPSWWTGRRFTGKSNINIWVCGDTRKTCRDILQYKLCGPLVDFGTGLIPKSAFSNIPFMRNQGIGNALDAIYIKRPNGIATVYFKSYDSGRDQFQGTEIDIILLDEECPIDIYDECGMRIMTSRGMIMLTFTPLMGTTPLIMLLFNNEGDGIYIVRASWDDAPHLSEQDKRKAEKLIPPWLRDARMRGIPSLGSGAIYPHTFEESEVDHFVIPDTFKRGYGMDVGWNRTALLFYAIDPNTHIKYITSEYYVGEKVPYDHAKTLMAMGCEWMRGIIDPGSLASSQMDGRNLFFTYKDTLKFDIVKANNAVETGLVKTYEGLVTGKIKFFKGLTNFKKEYIMYQRDEKGNIKKSNDHLMDCLRYIVMDEGKNAMSKEEYKRKQNKSDVHFGNNDIWSA